MKANIPKCLFASAHFKVEAFVNQAVAMKITNYINIHIFGYATSNQLLKGLEFESLRYAAFKYSCIELFFS